MLVVRFIGRERAAPAQVELAPHQRERVAQRTGVNERPEVTSPVGRANPREGETRNGIVEVDLEQEEPFVVAEADIVARVKILDQLAFEQQRLGLAPDHMHVEIVNGFDQGVELEIPAHPPRRMKILANPLAEIARLANVDDGAEAVLHEVHARLVGKLAELVPNGFGCWHDSSLPEPKAFRKR